MEPENTKRGVISLPGASRPSKALGRDDTRPLLRHAWLKRREDGLWLFATDSLIAVALKVDGAADEGFVPYQALRRIERGEYALQEGPTAWRFRGGARTEVVYDLGDRVDLDRMPKIDMLADGLIFNPPKFTAKMRAKPFGVDPHLVGRLGKALGRQVLHLAVTDVVGPIAVTTRDPRRRALLMPVRIPDSTRERRPTPRRTKAAA